MSCWDCGVRVGTVPAVQDHRTPGVVTIHKVCVRCANRWRPFMSREQGTLMHHDGALGRVTAPDMLS